jgi:V/A-type H+-transporting ATPase subunit E
MADQLQEMLQRIYTEGVDKAKAEADKIIETAKQQADKMKAEAEAEAENIIRDAKQKSAELEKNINSDLKMAAQQAMSALKHKIISSLFAETIDKHAEKSLQDNSFLQKLILEVLGKWSPDSSAVISIPENRQKDLEAFFRDSVKSVFSGSLKVDFSPIMTNGITIAPADGTFKLNFTDEDFANFFKSYLRPKAAQILFGE